MNPLKPSNWIAGLKRIPLHALFVGVGIAAHFIPPPYNAIALGGFAAWRAIAEHRDHRIGADTKGKAIIDWASQVGSAIGGAFIPLHF